MQIRQLHSEDVALHSEAIRLLNDGAMLTYERSAALLAEPTYVFIVALTDEEEIMGRIYGHILYRFESTDLLLYEVDVAEAHHRKGVGKAMMEFVKQYCQERGFGEMWVLTEEDNNAGRGLYLAAGGTEENSPAIMYVFR